MLLHGHISMIQKGKMKIFSKEVKEVENGNDGMHVVAKGERARTCATSNALFNDDGDDERDDEDNNDNEGYEDEASVKTDAGYRGHPKRNPAYDAELYNGDSGCTCNRQNYPSLIAFIPTKEMSKGEYRGWNAIDDYDHDGDSVVEEEAPPTSRFCGAVRFCDPMVTATIHRPATGSESKRKLYYSRRDLQRFKREASINKSESGLDLYLRCSLCSNFTC